MKIVSLKNKKTFLKRIWWLSNNEIINLKDLTYKFIVSFPYPELLLKNIKDKLIEGKKRLVFEEETTETHIKTTETKKTKKKTKVYVENIPNSNYINPKNKKDYIDVSFEEISEPPNQYNQKQLAKINQDFKISINNLSQEEIEKIIYNNLNKYIDWNNNIDKKSIIEKPVIFVNKYLDNPLSLTIDFTQYYAYLKKLDKEKTIEENQKQQEKLEQEKQKKEKYIDNLYEIFKECNKDEYKKLYEKYKKELLTTNNFLRMQYNSGKTSMLDIVIEGEIRKELAKRNNIC